MNLLEAVLTSAPVTALGPDILAHCEQLAILASTGKAKEAIGVQLTHEQGKHLSDKGLRRITKVQDILGAKTTETLIESFPTLTTRAVGMFVRVKDVEALQNELKKDYIISKELSALAGNLVLRCERLLAVANAALITTKHINFSTSSNTEDNAVEMEEKDESSSLPTEYAVTTC